MEVSAIPGTENHAKFLNPETINHTELPKI